MPPTKTSTPTSKRVEQAAALLAKAKTDYATYLRIIWPLLSFNKAPLTPYELDAFTWATGREPGRDSRRFLFCHREFGKSTGITYPLAPFLWLSDPTITGGVYTKSNPKAKEALTATRHLIRKCPMLQHLTPPDGHDDFQRDNTEQFSVKGAENPAVPSFKAMGSTSMSTGGRNNYVVFDDFETEENSVSIEARERTARRSREIIRTCREGAIKIGVGTYARDQSAYEEWIKDGWEHRIYPLLYPTDEEIELAKHPKTGVCMFAPIVLKWLREGKDYLGRPTAPGGIIQPERWTPEWVAEKRGSHLGEFRRHYQGIIRSAASDEQPLRLSDLMVLSCVGTGAPTALYWGLESAGESTVLDGSAPDRPLIEVDSCSNGDRFRKPASIDKHYQPWQGTTVAHIDPAGFGKDEMAWSVWSKLNGTYYNRALRGHRLRSDADPASDKITLTHALASIVADAGAFQIGLIQVEAQFGGLAIAESLRRMLRERGLPCRVETKPATGEKNRRILNTAKPLTYQHRVVIDEAVARDPVFQHQYTRLSPSPGCLEHDDRIEAWAAGLELVSTGDLAVPQETRIQQTLENDRDSLMEELGMTPEIHRWGDFRRQNI